MTTTFYIPKEDEDLMKAFIAKCNKEGKSYSSRLVELMREDIDQIKKYPPKKQTN